MSNDVRDKLKEMISRFGRETCRDAKRCEAILRDLCGQSQKREVFLLVLAVKQQVPAELMDANAGLPVSVLVNRLVRRIQGLGIGEDLARWAIESWAVGLGMIAEDQVSRGLSCPACQNVVLVPMGQRSGRLRCSSCKSDLEFNADSFILQQVEVESPQLVLPPPIQLGNLGPGEQGSFSIVLRNIGRQRADANLTPSDYHISLSHGACTIDPGSQVEIKCTLNTKGLPPGRQHVFYIDAQGPGGGRVPVHLFIRPPQPVLRPINPLKLGRLFRGRVTDTTLSLANDGDGPLVCELSRQDKATWLDIVPRQVRIAPKQEATVTLKIDLCNFPSDKDLNVTIPVLVHSNGGNCKVPINFQVVRPKPACLAVNHTQVDLGTLSTGDSQAFEIEVANSGDEPCQVKVILEEETWISASTEQFSLGSSEHQTLKFTFLSKDGSVDGDEVVETILLCPIVGEKAQPVKVNVKANAVKTSGPVAGALTATGIASLLVLPPAIAGMALGDDSFTSFLLHLFALTGLPVAIWLFGRLWEKERIPIWRLCVGFGGMLAWGVIVALLDLIVGGIARFILSIFLTEHACAMVVGTVVGAFAGFMLGFIAWIAIHKDDDDTAVTLGGWCALAGAIAFCVGGGIIKCSPIGEYTFYVLTVLATGIGLACLFPRAKWRMSNPWQIIACISPVLLIGLVIGGYAVVASTPSAIPVSGQGKSAERASDRPDLQDDVGAMPMWGNRLPMASLAKLGYRSGLQIDLKTRLAGPAVETALRERFTYVGRRDGTVFIWQAAPQNASVWIRTDDGRVVIASRGDLSHERTYAGLKVTWDMVSESLKSVTATLAKTDINQVFQETSEFFTASQGQYQYLLFNFQRRNQWALRWPDVRPAWARFIISSAPNYIHYSLQGKPIVSGTDGPNAADITDLAFGEHKLGVSLGFSQASPVVHAFFAKPQATIDVVEIEGGKSVASRQAVSRPLDSLEIPAFDVNTPTVPPIPQGRIVASELGFTSGVDAHLGAGVQLAPVRSSMEAKGWQVKDMIGSLSAYRRNRPDEVVWVFTDGRLIATGRQPLSTSKAIEALEGAWLEAATASAGVTAVLSGVDLRGRMFTSAHYYTARANQYQRLFDLGVDRTSSGLTLDWSNTAEAWVRVMWSGLNGQWKLDNSVLPSIPRTAAPYQVNAGHLTPGQHSLNWGGITSFTNHHDRKIWVKVDAFFPNPSEEIAWYDQSRSNAVTYPAYSQPIDRLWLPKEATK